MNNFNGELNKNFNNMNNLLKNLLFVFALLCITSCSKNNNSNDTIDGDNKEQVISIIGTWKLISDEGYVLDNGKKTIFENDESIGETITFYSNGKVTESGSDGGSGEWMKSDNTITVKSNDTGTGELLTRKINIISLSYSTLICDINGTESSNYSFYHKGIFERVE